MNESKYHNYLKQQMRQLYVGYEFLEEYEYKGKSYDFALLKKGKVVGLGECIVSQTIKEAYKRLKKPNIEKRFIVRFYKNKNPYSKNIIKKIRHNGIMFLEWDKPNTLSAVKTLQ